MRARILSLASAAVVLAASAFAAGTAQTAARPNAAKASSPSAKQPGNGCATCKEKRATLDPKRFKDWEPEVPKSYEVARKYPATLDRIHCFCECQESPKFQHKTLLTCFTDEHAAGCGICIKEALIAADLKARGASDEEIERLVESSFKTDGHAPTHDHGRP
jgi:hypothetical protein